MYFLSPVVLFLNFRSSLHLSPFLCLSIFPSLFLSKPLSLPSPSFIPVYLICPPSVFHPNHLCHCYCFSSFHYCSEWENVRSFQSDVVHWAGFELCFPHCRSVRCLTWVSLVLFFVFCILRKNFVQLLLRWLSPKCFLVQLYSNEGGKNWERDWSRNKMLCFKTILLDFLVLEIKQMVHNSDSRFWSKACNWWSNVPPMNHNTRETLCLSANEP